MSPISYGFAALRLEGLRQPTQGIYGHLRAGALARVHSGNYVVFMPIIDVTHSAQVAEEQLARLAQALPHAVSLAVECPEEPYDEALQPGDVEVRFRRRGPYDISGLDVVVEVRSKWFPSRAETRQERCDRLCDVISQAAGTSSVGVYLSLPVAAWAQGE